MTQAFADRIRYDDSLMLQLQQAITQAAKNRPRHPDLHLTRKPRGGSSPEFTIEIAASSLTQIYLEPVKRQQAWTLVEVIRRDASVASVLMGCRFNFEMEGAASSYFLVSASLIFLSNLGAPFPLIRAEWDYRSLSETKSESHAQPHWHILTALQEGTQSQADAAFVMTMPRAFDPVGAAQHIEKLHLAMSADWHDPSGKTHQRSIPDSAGMRNWVEKTAKYSIEQITYAFRRSGAHRPITKEFRP